MIKAINECSALKIILNTNSLHCQNLCYKYPSYIDRKTGLGSGCLIAHIALCLYELGRIWRRIRIIRSTLGDENIIALILLHDIGKGTKWYKDHPKMIPHHNTISASYAWMILDHEKVNIRVAISFAIYLHHEAYIWREKGVFHLSVNLQKELNGFLRRLSKNSRLFLVDNNIFDALIKLIPLFSKLDLDKAFLQLCEKTINEIQKKTKYQNSIYKATTEFKRYMARNLEISLPLLYILYLIDNRAARRRKDPYWEVKKFIQEDFISKTLVPV